MVDTRADRLDKVIKRDDIRASYPDCFDDELAYYLARAAARVFLLKGRRVVVGWDARLSSPALAVAVVDGLSEEGADIWELGQCGTELVSFAVCGVADIAAGVMITASHSPKDENGLKIARRGEHGAEPASREDLRRIGEEAKALFKSAAGYIPRNRPCRRLNCISEYVRVVRRASRIEELCNAEQPKLKVAVEAGHGMGAVMFGEAVSGLDFLDVIYSHSQPNGAFPAGVPNPVDPSYMKSAGEFTTSVGADLGLAFDGDADRVGVVDNKGEVVSPSEVATLIARRFLESCNQDHNIKIMYNLVCSRLVRDEIDHLNGIPWMTPVGYSQIRRRMHMPEHHNCIFAGEHSGHYIFRDFFRADSGVTAALIITGVALRAKAAGISLHDVVSQWRKRYFTSNEKNFRLDRDGSLSESQLRAKMQATMQRIRDRYGSLDAVRELYPNVTSLQTVSDYAPGDPIEPQNGVDILKMEFTEDFGSWWFSVRSSGSEPFIRLVAEVILNDGASADGHNLLKDRFDRIDQLICA